MKRICILVVSLSFLFVQCGQAPTGTDLGQKTAQSQQSQEGTVTPQPAVKVTGLKPIMSEYIRVSGTAVKMPKQAQTGK